MGCWGFFCRAGGTAGIAVRGDSGLRHRAEPPLRFQHQEQLRPPRPDGAAAAAAGPRFPHPGPRFPAGTNGPAAAPRDLG